MLKGVSISTLSVLVLLAGSAANAQSCAIHIDYVNRMVIETDLVEAKASGAAKRGDKKTYCSLLAEHNSLFKKLQKGIDDAIACMGYATPNVIEYRDKARRIAKDVNDGLYKYCR